MNSEEMNNTSEPTGTGSTSPEESTPEASPPPTPPTQSGGADDGVGRRDILKALAGVPFVGWIFWRALRKKGLDDYRKEQILEELGDLQGPSFVSDIHHPAGEKIRLGIIGYGGEGNWLTRCAGFATKATTDAWTEAVARDPGHTALRDFMNQPDLNLEITAVCDVFDNRAEAVMDAARNTTRPGGEGKPVPEVKRYRHYRDLLASGDVDAVIIATPDHWHSRMAIEAARQGIHVYLEKAMTRTEQEALDLHRAVTEAGIAFQLGHQNRQIESHEKAREVVERGILGDINLVETTTNRNTPGGAWVYGIDPEGSPETIDWELFQEPAPHHVPFSAERFFRWRCWFDYGTGLSGDLFSHEYDSVNQILHLGIPERVSATGGIYFYRTDRFHDIFDPEEYPMQENRDVPDVFHISCEYPERRLTDPAGDHRHLPAAVPLAGGLGADRRRHLGFGPLLHHPRADVHLPRRGAPAHQPPAHRRVAARHPRRGHYQLQHRPRPGGSHDLPYGDPFLPGRPPYALGSGAPPDRA